MIKIHRRQAKNAVMKYLGQTNWIYDNDIRSDFEVNGTTAVLFLSLKYHSEKPDYIFSRMRKVRDHKLVILIILVNVPDFNEMLLNLYKTVSATIVLGRNNEECASYVRSLDQAAKRPIETRRNQTESNSFLADLPFLSSGNQKTVQTEFSSLREFINADQSDLIALPGFGAAKAAACIDIFRRPFK